MKDIRFFAKPKYKASWALIVGIDNYKNASPLSYAVSDASEIREVLVNELGFPSSNITYLVDGDATKENILKSFMRFARNDIEVDDRIFVFFAGHGQTKTGIRGEVGYLVAYDSDSDDLSTYIRWDDLTRNSELVHAKHIFFVMDACYGGLALTRTLGPGSTRFLKDMMLRYARQVLTAGKADEVVADSGGPLPNHSIFTGHLIEGMQGKAATADGVITATGLMAYVYQRVANDKNSGQTPHYGFFDGDGDFILREPSLHGTEDEGKKGLDELVVIPFSEQEHSADTTEQKIETVKTLLADSSSSIRLHDFLINEVKRFLADTSDEQFPLQDSFSKESLLERIAKYDDSALDLAGLMSCLAFWGAPKVILQKVISRLADRLESQSGVKTWLDLRWYPIIRALYCSGMAAVDGQRYDSLATILYTKIGTSRAYEKEKTFIEAVTDGLAELTSSKVFKQLPGYEQNFTPLSEYLFKILQPQLDDILFMGKNYERSFDEFEILLALVAADNRKQNGSWVWGPVGRFGWKQFNYPNSPFTRLVEEAKLAGDDWPPLKGGLFGGSIERFSAISQEFHQEVLARLHWY